MMKNLGIKKWFKRNQEEVSYENVTCKNCETQFDGKYCPECGQSVKDYDKPFSFIFYNFVGDFFAFDVRLFKTFVALLTKPGFLTKEYFKGRRKKFTPPFRVFIFVSFVLFLLLQIYTNRGLTSVLDSDFSDSSVGLDSTYTALADSIIKDVYAELDSNEVAATDSFLNKYGVNPDTSEANNYNLQFDLETFRDTRDMRQGLNKIAIALEEKLQDEEDPKQREKLREHIRLCRSPEQATAKILEYLSWAFFLLLPIFALVLKLIYIRRKHNYMKHLVFSIHIHSFLFLIMIFIVGLYMIFKGNLEIVSTILIFSFPIYFMIALKKFYGQTIGKVILKFFAISILYNTILWITVGIVFLEALSII